MSLIGYMMDLAVANSFLLYKRHATSLEECALSEDEDKEENATLITCSKSFKLSISKFLMGQGPLGAFSGGPKVKGVIKMPRGLGPDETLRYDRVDHWPTYKMTQGRCKYCKKGYTTICCVKCNEISLCYVPSRQCFLKFHLPEME